MMFFPGYEESESWLDGHGLVSCMVSSASIMAEFSGAGLETNSKTLAARAGRWNLKHSQSVLANSPQPQV